MTLLTSLTVPANNYRSEFTVFIRWSNEKMAPAGFCREPCQRVRFIM